MNFDRQIVMYQWWITRASWPYLAIVTINFIENNINGAMYNPMYIFVHFCLHIAFKLKWIWKPWTPPMCSITFNIWTYMRRDCWILGLASKSTNRSTEERLVIGPSPFMRNVKTSWNVWWMFLGLNSWLIKQKSLSNFCNNKQTNKLNKFHLLIQFPR